MAFMVIGAITSFALAQDVTTAMPGEYIAPGAPSPPEQVHDPTTILQDDGSTFSIPIPGGGDIVVEGPSSETSATRSPIENWATQRNNPSSVGGVPLGPAPSQR